MRRRINLNMKEFFFNDNRIYILKFLDDFQVKDILLSFAGGEFGVLDYSTIDIIRITESIPNFTEIDFSLYVNGPALGKEEREKYFKLYIDSNNEMSADGDLLFRSRRNDTPYTIKVLNELDNVDFTMYKNSYLIFKIYSSKSSTHEHSSIFSINMELN